ncbi:choline transporter-like protein 1 [Watersipora subatra]|uniref:choline transporter-like protein 1 n=1 Tax=Watersipora subatra TaxID=2589382 RepID=UPI00355B01EA
MGACCCCCADPDKEEYPPLGNPVKKRSCTDIPCCLVFGLYWAGMIGILVYCLLFGRVERLLNGFDDYGNTCGVENNHQELVGTGHPYVNQDMTDRPYQFFLNYLQLKTSYLICVKECPTRQIKDMPDLYKFANETGSLLCNYNVPVEDYPRRKTNGLFYVGDCPAFEIPVEEPLLGRCIPEDVLTNTVGQLINETIIGDFTNFFAQYNLFNEIGRSFIDVRFDLLILLGTALGMSLILVFLLRFVIKVVVWFIVIATALVAVGGTVYFWVVYYQLVKGIDQQKTHNVPIIQLNVDAETAFLVYSITATVLTVILLLVIIVMRKRLQLAVALFQEAGRVLENTPLILIQPIWTYLFQGVVIAVGIIMLIFCSGLTDIKVADMEREGGPNGTHNAIDFVNQNPVSYFGWVIIIGVVWMIEFAIAVQELIIAGTVADWFFTRNKKTLSCTICKATSRTVIYHLGSAAFGSFLITLIRIPRYLLMKLDKKLKESGNECAQFMLKCCICLLYCLEKCMKYINRNAYIVIAISSTNFCKARVKAFNTLLSNVLRVVAINTVGDFVIFLGKVLIMSANTIISYFLFDRHNKDLPYGMKNFYILPILAVAIFSYLIAHCFLSSFEMLVDTLLLCFCEDVKINDGTPEKPYYMSKNLMKFVANSSKAINKQDKVNTDQTDASASEREVLAAGDVSADEVRLTVN